MGTERGGAHSFLPKGRGNLTGAAKWIVAALFFVPLLLVIYKLSKFPGAETLKNILSLTSISEGLYQRVEYIMIVPLAAVLVVIFRVMLGIRLLGPFRSILLAVAFRITGIPVGLFFLIIVVAVIVAISPLLKAIRLPYFARVSTALSAVALIILITLVMGRWMNADSLQRVAYFPIVVLCLTGDGFARTISREGLRSAIWRGSMTALTAVLISGLAGSVTLSNLMIRFPEFMLLEISLIIIVSEYFGFRLLSSINPPPKRKKGGNNVLKYASVSSTRNSKPRITSTDHSDRDSHVALVQRNCSRNHLNNTGRK